MAEKHTCADKAQEHWAAVEGERLAKARAEWEADHEKNGGSTYFNEMVHLQRKCVALGTDVETYKRLALENGAARDHAIKEWHLSQDRNAELSAKLDRR